MDTIAFIGNPNVGKTSLLNHIAGTQLTIGNWSGTTVNKAQAEVEHNGKSYTLVDLPGTYSLAKSPEDERITYQYILEDQASHYVFVCDSGNLQRSLVLLSELAILKKPTLVILNLIDEAEDKGLLIDDKKLAEHLQTPVLVTNASQGTGLTGFWEALKKSSAPHIEVHYPTEIQQFIEQLDSPISQLIALQTLCDETIDNYQPEIIEQSQHFASSLIAAQTDPFIEVSDARYQAAQELAQKVSESPGVVSHKLTEKIDNIVTHPIWGIPILAGILLLIFRITYTLADPWIEWVGMVQGVLSGWVTTLFQPLPLLGSLIAQGIVEGLGVLYGFVPILLILYLGLSILERSGLMARVAYLADGFMEYLGLSGRSAIPLILGFGCNVPAVYAARSLSSKQEQLKVAMAVPFMACSARVAVFAVFIPLFFPSYPSLILLGLFSGGATVGLLTAAWVHADELNQETASSLVELPPYRLPSFKVLWKQAVFRTSQFIRRSTVPITATVVVIWAMLHVHIGEQNLYHYLAEHLSFLFKLIGFSDWHLIGALFPGIIAKEVVIASLSVSYFGLETIEPLGFTEGLVRLLEGTWEAVLATFNTLPSILGLPHPFQLEGEASDLLVSKLRHSVSQIGALSYLTFLLLYTPCIATIMAIADEHGRWWGWFSVFYQLAIAFIISGVVYWLGVLLT